MPRNQKFELAPHQVKVAALARNIALPLVSNESKVTVAFTKRDGTGRILTGTAVRIDGDGCSETLSVMTDDGIRSANLWSITKIVPLG